MRYEQSDSYKILRDDKRLSAAKSLAVFLWFAGHEACSLRDLSDRFNLTVSSISRVIDRVAMFISGLSPEVIKWRSNERKQESANYFAQLGFPKSIRCIDGTHIRISPLSERKDDYIARKGHITLVMQSIRDERRKFINVFVGFPGSSHDSWVLQNSPVYNNLTTLCGDYYLLGDSAYPCSDCIITPFKDNGHLTRDQKYFNKQLSKCRILIEHSFGILKQRFRQLYYCKLKDSEEEEINEDEENIIPTRNINVRYIICQALSNRRREL
ncbi:PREDICTED: putative nuclease HARBI1 [Rhagoletis zephyria]|uniref:putative nuclease HARBI1 n=1 Tax=Rhagoletis zephyria TaxID=28612 RepID=UPI00081152D0|nr:PREDICTED: putative nuclease HARBI1 [Rhagoletis zephyria]